MNKAIAGILLAAGLAGFMAQPEAVAQEQTIYKWVDVEGVVHYSARPPDDVEYEEVDIRNREPVDPAADGGKMAEAGPPAEPERSLPEQPQMETTAPDPEMVAERCAQARDNLEKLNRHANLVISDEDGQRRAITNEERRRMLQEAQQFIDEWC